MKIYNFHHQIIYRAKWKTGISNKGEESSLTNCKKLSLITETFLWLAHWQVKSQGVTEELRCLGLLNALDKNRDIPEDLAQLLGESCIKLAEGIKAYISKVSLHLELVKKHKSSITQPVKPMRAVTRPVYRQLAHFADSNNVQISAF